MTSTEAEQSVKLQHHLDSDELLHFTNVPAIGYLYRQSFTESNPEEYRDMIEIRQAANKKLIQFLNGKYGARNILMTLPYDDSNEAVIDDPSVLGVYVKTEAFVAAHTAPNQFIEAA